MSTHSAQQLGSEKIEATYTRRIPRGLLHVKNTSAGTYELDGQTQTVRFFVNAHVGFADDKMTAAEFWTLEVTQ
jgi:hypothetical protein